MYHFAFAGFLRCAHDGCVVTTELQKSRYVYYRCSQGRGKCSLPYMREEQVSERLAELLENIYVPEAIARTVVNSLHTDVDRTEQQRKERLAGLQQRLATVRTRMDKLYEDKLDGTVDNEFWSRKQAEYREQEHVLQSSIAGLSAPFRRESVLTVERIFELANKAHYLYLTRNAMERGELLKSVLLNCTTDGVNLSPTYRKPFDPIFQRAKNQEWSGRADLNCRPLAPQASALPG
jgi:site-specific DNA recombinase